MALIRALSKRSEIGKKPSSLKIYSESFFGRLARMFWCLPILICIELLWPAQARAARKPFVLRIMFVEVQGYKDPLRGMHKDFLKAARLVVRQKFGIKLDWKIVDPVDSRELFFRARDSTALHWAQQMKFDLETEASPEAL